MATILQTNHPKVQYLVRRYMYCCWRANTAKTRVRSMCWRTAGCLYGDAISRMIGSENWEFPYPQCEARSALLDKRAAMPVIMSMPE